MKLLLPFFFGTATASILHKDNLPSTGEQWQSGTNGVEFQPAEKLSPLAQEHLRRLTGSNLQSPYANDMLDGAETYYDEYAQAWRALGMYIDCDACDEENTYGCLVEQEDRKLGDDDDAGCPRYMLWAAYIDEEYSGNEIGEYIFWDRHAQTWSDEACQETNSNRCVKMDCHEADTHFSLLGFFKEPNYDEWMEQLFKHEGNCVWSETEYEFMQSERETWPGACTVTPFMDDTSGGGYIYYDIKPEQYGGMGIGLYTDSGCIVEYKDDKYSIATVIRAMSDDDDNNNNGDGDDHDDDKASLYELEETLAAWNDAFDVYKQCQPCKAYDLSNYVSGKKNQWSRKLQGTHQLQGTRKLSDDEDGDFNCHDDAGYNDVNQCMKFATHTKMMVATYRDIEMAGAQGTITSATVGSHQFGNSQADRIGDVRKLQWSWTALGASMAFLVGSAFLFVRARNRTEGEFLSEPLVPSSGVSA